MTKSFLGAEFTTNHGEHVRVVDRLHEKQTAWAWLHIGLPLELLRGFRLVPMDHKPIPLGGWILCRVSELEPEQNDHGEICP